jgi:hypothetical protein
MQHLSENRARPKIGRALVTYELTLDNSCEESGGNRAAMMR